MKELLKLHEVEDALAEAKGLIAFKPDGSLYRVMSVYHAETLFRECARIFEDSFFDFVSDALNAKADSKQEFIEDESAVGSTVDFLKRVGTDLTSMFANAIEAGRAEGYAAGCKEVESKVDFKTKPAEETDNESVLPMTLSDGTTYKVVSISGGADLIEGAPHYMTLKITKPEFPKGRYCRYTYVDVIA